MFKNRNLLVVGLISIVNALGYGIIIPIIYTYSMKFGLTDAQNGLLFAAFSASQFISTPIIGRLSDKYGRKPLLVVSIAGTAVSFLMAAFAPNAIFLFMARILDGLTAGNLPVVSAVISDTTKPEERAKAFGIIGASFGFGFVFGPAIAGLTLGFGLQVPFIIAALISLLATVLTIVLLPETNKHIGQITTEKLFDLRKLITMLFDDKVGLTLLITLLFSTAFGLFIFAFQPYAVKGLNLTPNFIAGIYTLFGLVGIISQAVLIPRIVKWLGEKATFVAGLSCFSIAFLGLYLSRSFGLFIAACILLSISNSFINPLIQTFLSKETDEKSQGSIQGLNASYMSIGTTLGPIAGGVLAGITVRVPFLAGCILGLACLGLSIKILRMHFAAKESAF